MDNGSPTQKGSSSLGKKYLWFIGLWLLGFLTLSIIGYSIRLIFSL